MKPLPLLLLIIITAFACSTTESKQEDQKELTDLEKIASAHGFENFTQVNFLQYSFNVQRDTSVSTRTWNWYPKTGRVTYIKELDTLNYQLGQVTEDIASVDHRFINDKYWLLFPFQLVWDENIAATNHGAVISPISGTEHTKITIQYGSEGGYTPGDAYDIYVDGNWIIREWAFRKSGREEPGLITTWEDYQDLNGLKIATNHLTKDGNFRLFFTDLVIK